MNEGQAGLYSSGLKYFKILSVGKSCKAELLYAGMDFPGEVQQYISAILKLFIAINTQAYFSESTFGKWPDSAKDILINVNEEGCLNTPVEYYAALKLMHRINF